MSFTIAPSLLAFKPIAESGHSRSSKAVEKVNSQGGQDVKLSAAARTNETSIRPTKRFLAVRACRRLSSSSTVL